MHLSLLYGNLKMYSILQMTHPQLERKQQCLKDVLSTLTKGNLLRGIDIWSHSMARANLKKSVWLADKYHNSNKVHT